MDTGKRPPSSDSSASASERLDSWKEIAGYLKRDESTVRRWEKEGLPVHRRVHEKKATVYAYKSEIDVWWSDGRVAEVPQGLPWWGRKANWWAAVGVMLFSAGVLATFNVGGLRDRILGRPAAGEITSIAVLPLVNLSGDSQQDYFADGMTEAFITELGKIGALRVISRQSVMHYKGSKKSAPQIARELNVEAIVEGSVVRSNDRARISVQLIKASPERHLWTNSYDRHLRDVLDVYSEVARAIASEIKVKLTPEQKALLARARSVDPEVYQLCLKGFFHLHKHETENFEKALDYFGQAIERNPRYAPAYAGMAFAYMELGGWASTSPGSGMFPKAREAALKALELDDTLADAYIALAEVMYLQWDWPAAERAFKRGMEFNPNSYSLIWYANFLDAMGRLEDSIAVGRQIVAIDPLSPDVYNELGLALENAGHYEEAVLQYRKGLELDVNYRQSHVMLALHYIQRGKVEDALAEAEWVMRLARVPKGSLGWMGYVYAKAGRRADALTILHKLNVLARNEYVSPATLANVYLGLGENDKAIALLQQAYAQRDVRLVWLKVVPIFDTLRSDPRFQEIVRRMNFPN